MAEYLPILNGLRNMSRLYDKFSLPLCEEKGIAKAEMDVLAFLSNHKGKDTARDIEKMRMMPKANVSQAVEALIRKQFLIRVPDKSDRRKIHLLITENAESAVGAVHKMQREFFAALFGDFTDEEFSSFKSAVEKITENASNALKGRGKNG